MSVGEAIGLGRKLNAVEMGLLAAMMASLLCRRKSAAVGGFVGGAGLGEAWDLATRAPEFLTNFVAEQFDAALAALEQFARSFGLGFLADAFARARNLFQQLKDWAEGLFGKTGQMLLTLVLIYLVYSRFFLRQ